MFPDASSIAPYLEHPKTGPTASFCSTLAKRLQCFVIAGFPERLVSSSPPEPSASISVSLPPPSPDSLGSHPFAGANAASLFDPIGRVVHTYHKSNLFSTDLTWARAGRGFETIDLPAPFGRFGVAICNDLNVTAGDAWMSIEGGPYELAMWCRREGVRVLVLLNAWLRPEDGGMENVEEGGGEDGNGNGNGNGLGGERDRVGSPGEDGEDGEDGLEPNWDVLNYWAMRLRPLWATSASSSKDVDEQFMRTLAETVHANEQQEVIVVVCNRFGHERGKTFAGSSAMFAMRLGSGKPRLLHVMGEREEGVRVWTARVGS